MSYISHTEWANIRNLAYTNLNTGRYTMPLTSYNPISHEKKEICILYDTLQAGHRHHHLLLSNDMEFVDKVTIAGYSLVEVSCGTVGAVKSANGIIFAELYKLNSENTKIIDIIKQGYQKHMVTIPYQRGYLDCVIWEWPNNENREIIPYAEWDLNVEAISYKGGLNAPNRTSL